MPSSKTTTISHNGPSFLSRRALSTQELPSHILRLTQFGFAEDESPDYPFLYSNVHVVPLDEQAYELWRVPQAVKHHHEPGLEIARTSRLSLVRIVANEHARSSRSSLAQAS